MKQDIKINNNAVSFSLQNKRGTQDRTQIINQICKLKRKAHLSYEENRYIDKKVRQKLGLIRPKKQVRLPVHLNPAEFYLFRKAAYHYRAKFGLMVDLLCCSGIRVNELVNIKIDDLDTVQNKLFVRKGKGNKQRYTLVQESIVNSLLSYLDGRKRGYIFESILNTKYTTRSINKMFNAVQERIKLNKNVTPHVLRDTFACFCIASGMRLEEIQVLMGHSNRQTTEIYAKLEFTPELKEKYLLMWK